MKTADWLWLIEPEWLACLQLGGHSRLACCALLGDGKASFAMTNIADSVTSGTLRCSRGKRSSRVTSRHFNLSMVLWLGRTAVRTGKSHVIVGSPQGLLTLGFSES